NPSSRKDESKIARDAVRRCGRNPGKSTPFCQRPVGPLQFLPTRLCPKLTPCATSKPQLGWVETVVANSVIFGATKLIGWQNARFEGLERRLDAIAGNAARPLRDAGAA